MKLVIRDPNHSTFTIQFSEDELAVVVDAMQQFDPAEYNEVEVLLANELLANLEEIAS